VEPAPEDDSALTLSKFLEAAGPSGPLALLAGVAILVYGIRLARRGAPRSLSLALFVLACTAALPVLDGAGTDPLRVLGVVTLRWTTPGAGAMAMALRGGWPPNPAGLLTGSIGLFLGLVGSVAALSRSRSVPQQPTS
jgi:hypothetical protein